MGLRMDTMWNTLKSGIAARTARIARGGLALLCALSMALVPAEIAVAGDARLVKIDQGGSGQSSRSIVLGLGKAASDELPVAAREVLVSNPEIVDAGDRSNKRSYLIDLAGGRAD